jgi:8-amino-7-oxononanoate synthase
MLDFTSSLYLGFHHAHRSLQPWSLLTTGKPAALSAPQSAQQIAQRIAVLQGCEAGSLGTSSLHLFWDLFGILTLQAITIFVDSGLYPIARWGVERAASRGAPVYEFAHHNPGALERAMHGVAGLARRPVVVTDGFCPACGRPAPLREYLSLLQNSRGRLILDDTQALGIFGHSPGVDAPFGSQGGGMLPWLKIASPDILVVSSLAKAFGVPAAVLSGSLAAVREFEAKSETRVHCSPPSLAAIHAVEHALLINAETGDRLRLRLARLVAYFRRRADSLGLRFAGGLFPVQTLRPQAALDAAVVYEHLASCGIRTVLKKANDGNSLELALIITARHNSQSIDRLIHALAINRIPDAHLPASLPAVFGENSGGV